MTKGRVVAIAWPLVLWWLLLTAATIAITWVCRQISDAGLLWAGMDVQRVLPLVALYMAVALVGAFLYSGLQMAGHQFLVTRMYGEQRDPGRWVVPATLELDDHIGSARRAPRDRSHRRARRPRARNRVVPGHSTRPRGGRVGHCASRCIHVRAGKHDGRLSRRARRGGHLRRARRPTHARRPHRRDSRPRLHARRRRPAQGGRAHRGRARDDRYRATIRRRLRGRASAAARRRDRARAGTNEDQRRAQVQRAGSRARAGGHRPAAA